MEYLDFLDVVAVHDVEDFVSDALSISSSTDC